MQKDIFEMIQAIFKDLNPTPGAYLKRYGLMEHIPFNKYGEIRDFITILFVARLIQNQEAFSLYLTKLNPAANLKEALKQAYTEHQGSTKIFGEKIEQMASCSQDIKEKLQIFHKNSMTSFQSINRCLPQECIDMKTILEKAKKIC
jgi:hypothetical protein